MRLPTTAHKILLLPRLDSSSESSYTILQSVKIHCSATMATPYQLQAAARSRSNETVVDTTCPNQSRQLTPCQLRQQMGCSNTDSLPKWLIPADRRGWRRVVQNFTPSWVRRSLFELPHHFTLLTTLVCRDNGNRDSRDSVPRPLHALSYN